MARSKGCKPVGNVESGWTRQKEVEMLCLNPLGQLGVLYYLMDPMEKKEGLTFSLAYISVMDRDGSRKGIDTDFKRTDA